MAGEVGGGPGYRAGGTHQAFGLKRLRFSIVREIREYAGRPVRDREAAAGREVNVDLGEV